MSDKPKEFWIEPKLHDPIEPTGAQFYYAYDMIGAPDNNEIHVIEYTAFQALQQKLEASEEKEVIK